MNAEFAATPYNTNGVLVGVEESGNIVIVRPRSAGGELWRLTVTDVAGLIDCLRNAKTDAAILDDLR